MPPYRTRLDQLIDSSEPSYSPALLALRRWLRGAAKQGAIAGAICLLLINLSLNAHSAYDTVVETATEPTPTHQSATIDARNLISVPSDTAALTHRKAFNQRYMGLVAYTTQPRLTHSRLALSTQPPQPVARKFRPSER